MKMSFEKSLVVLCLSLATAADGSLFETQRRFADDLTTILHSSKTENDCTSSLGVSMAMSLLYPSMKGDASLQVERVFGFDPDASKVAVGSTEDGKFSSFSSIPSSSNLEWTVTTNTLNERFQGNCAYQNIEGSKCTEEEPTVVISNSVWTQEGRNLMPTYDNLLGEIEKKIDLKDDNAGDKVNGWVKKVTNDLIDSIVDEGPLSPLTSLAINAIYLKASWKKAFQKGFTNQDVFYHSSESKKDDAYFMHKLESMNHYFNSNSNSNEGYQVVELPFFTGMSMRSADSFSTYLVLPAVDGDFISSATLVDDILKNNRLAPARVALGMPKFQFSSTYKGEDLIPALASVGVTAPFAAGNMCMYVDDNCQSFIDYVIQKTYVSVDEGGMEAAAVTAMNARVTSVGVDAPPPTPILFLANRPFQFFVYDSKTDVVMLEGVVRDPVFQPQQQDDIQVTKKHEDEDFWKDTFMIQEQPVLPSVVDPSKNAGRSTLTSPADTPRLSSSILCVVGFVSFLGSFFYL